MKNILTVISTAICLFSNYAIAQIEQNYYVKDIPGLPADHGLTMHAGHIEIDQGTSSNIFFYLVNAKKIIDKQRLIIWLNGGPGCSSMDGLFMETGPFRMNTDQTLYMVEQGSWNEYANVLYIDQPVGTGFSYASADSYLTELEPMAKEFMTFIDRFFTIFPEYQSQDIYVAGESYAGQYIPYIAKAMLDRNAQTPAVPINLKGVLIGNGWMDSTTQYDAYMEYAYAENLIKKGAKNAENPEKQYAKCKQVLEANKNKPKIHYGECEEVLTEIVKQTITMKGNDKMCVNEYDIRLEDLYPWCGMKWPQELATVTPYLQRKDVVAAIRADKKKEGWVECSGGVGVKFKPETSALSSTLLPGLIESGLNILLFAGDRDIICNHLGIEAMIAKMKWAGSTGFSTEATPMEWTVDEKVVGTYQEDRNLTYVVVRNSSHMVGYDLPVETHDMLIRFIGLDTSLVTDYPVKSRVGEKAIVNPVDESYDAGKWDAYYNAGTAALVVVLILTAALGWFVYRNRVGSRRLHLGNGGLFRRHSSGGEAIKLTRANGRDDELEELVVESPMFDIGENEDEEDEHSDEDRYHDHERQRLRT